MFDKSQPLWLPKGSVRAILALIAGIVFAVLAFTTLPVEATERIVMVVFTAYFVQKAAQRAE